MKKMINEGPKGHRGHYYKRLDVFVHQLLKEKQQLKEQMRVELDKVDSAIEYFSGVEEQFNIQKDLYLKKLAADFEVIRKLIERK